MSIEIKNVNCGAFSLKYFSFGKGSKVMIILPGLSVQSVMGSAAAIKAQYRIFENEYSVYVLDRRENLPEDYNMEAMAEDTAAAINSLELRDAYIFGASQGGMLAMLIAAKYPELVKKLVLGSTTAKVSAEHFKDFKKWTDLARKGDAEGLYMSFCEGIYPPDMFEKYKGVFLEFAKMTTNEDLARFVILAGAAEGFDITDRLEKISCPTLVLGVKGDKVVGEDGSKMIAEKISDSKVYFYDEKYGHSAFDTAPDYTERIYNFFEE